MNTYPEPGRYNGRRPHMAPRRRYRAGEFHTIGERSLARIQEINIELNVDRLAGEFLDGLRKTAGDCDVFEASEVETLFADFVRERRIPTLIAKEISAQVRREISLSPVMAA
jgi:hypothetical protein